MKKILLLFVVTFIGLTSFPAYASPDNNKESEIVIVNQLTDEEIQYIESLPSVNEETSVLSETTNSYVDLGIYKLTAYCPCNSCNYPYGGQPTKLGTDYVEGRTIAVDPKVIPLGSIVEINIPGEGWHQYRAEDIGNRIKGNRIDILVNGHSNCLQSRYNGYCEVRLVL